MNYQLVRARICLAAANLKIAEENSLREDTVSAVESAVSDAIAHLEDARRHLMERGGRGASAVELLNR